MGYHTSKLKQMPCVYMFLMI